MKRLKAPFCSFSLIFQPHVPTRQTEIRHLWHNKASIYTSVAARTRRPLLSNWQVFVPINTKKAAPRTKTKGEIVILDSSAFDWAHSAFWQLTAKNWPRTEIHFTPAFIFKLNLLIYLFYDSSGVDGDAEDSQLLLLL